MSSFPEAPQFQPTITRHKKRFAEVLAALPKGQNGVYGIGRPWQLSSTEVGIVANIRSWGSDVVDLELGNDLLIIDNLDTQKPKAVVPINRTEKQTDPETGKSWLLAKYPLCGEFVPLGTLRPDGSPHPHAGTGFAIGTVLGFPLNAAGEITIRFTGHMKKQPPLSYELQQYRFDGENFFIEHRELLAPNALLNGWEMRGPALGNGVTDGDDFLTAIIGRPVASTAKGTQTTEQSDSQPYLARWKRSNGQWQLAKVTSVSDETGFSEPSLIRDTNGDLLYSARDGGKDSLPLMSVWRSKNNGNDWEYVIRKEGVRSQAPVAIYQTLDGTPYLVSSPPEGDDFNINTRPRLHLWPLSPERTDILEPISVRDCPAEFGTPQYQLWRVDHPIAANLRLADGAWHHLLCYRIMEEHGAPPTKTTGLYVEEILTERTIIPPWKFPE